MSILFYIACSLIGYIIGRYFIHGDIEKKLDFLIHEKMLLEQSRSILDQERMELDFERKAYADL